MSSRPMNAQEALAKFAAELADYKDRYGRYQHAKVLERLDAAIERVSALAAPTVGAIVKDASIYGNTTLGLLPDKSFICSERRENNDAPFNVDSDLCACNLILGRLLDVQQLLDAQVGFQMPFGGRIERDHEGRTFVSLNIQSDGRGGELFKHQIVQCQECRGCAVKEKACSRLVYNESCVIHSFSPSVCPHCHGVAGAHSPASAKHTEGEPQRRGSQ